MSRMVNAGTWKDANAPPTSSFVTGLASSCHSFSRALKRFLASEEEVVDIEEIVELTPDLVLMAVDT